MPGPPRESDGSALLEVRDLAVSYGGALSALQGVSLTVPQGSVVAVLGSNGAGKSTLLRAISGTLALQGGSAAGGIIRFEGKDVRDVGPAEAVRAGIVQVPEGRRIFGELTVEENLRAGAMTVPASDDRARAYERVFDLFPRLEERRRQRGVLLSGGEQQMLAIGRALMSAPKLLLLDEPSLGLAPQVVERIAEVIREINRQGTSVVLVEQNAAMALDIATTAYVLEVGRVALEGSAEELAKSPEVQERYLGGSVEQAQIATPTAKAPKAKQVVEPLVAEGLTIRFGGITAIQDVSFTVEPGTIHALIGPERRRQVDDAERADRRLRADRGHGPLRRPDAHGAAAAPHRAAAHQPDLPEHRAVADLDRGGQPAARAPPSHARELRLGRPGPAVGAPRARRAAPQGARDRRPPRLRAPPRPPGGRAELRRPQAGRARAGAVRRAPSSCCSTSRSPA